MTKSSLGHSQNKISPGSIFKSSILKPFEHSLKNQTWNSHMIRLFHIWVHTPKRREMWDLNRYLHTRVHSGMIHSSKNGETTPVSIRG